MTFPASSVISAVLRSHSNWSNGLILGSLNVLSIVSAFLIEAGAPLPARVALSVAERRRPWEGTSAKTCSLATIIVFLLPAVPPVTPVKRPSTKQSADLVQIRRFLKQMGLLEAPHKPH
jgi:hypothetical protein